MIAIIKYLLALFSKPKLVEQPKETVVSVKEVFTLKDYLTASGSYPERENHKELTPEYLENAKKLLTKVNQLLADLGITSAKISSGFRPTAVNAATKGAAKKSNHTICRAVDIIDDKGQSLAKRVQKLEEEAKDGFLVKYELWLEHPEATKGVNSNWCHLDLSTSRTARKVRIFRP